MLFIIVGVTTACDSFFNDTKELYDPREHPVIMAGDTLVFIGTENVDSFYVWESQFYKSRERYGDEDYDQYRGRMNLMNYNDTIIRLGISIINTWYSLYYYYQFRTHLDPVLSSQQPNKKSGGYSLQIGDLILSDLYRAIFKKEEYDMFTAVETAYYSKTYGFVKYIKYTGEEFVLSEESLAMLMARE